MPISAPALLTADHDVSQFDCQHPSLTDWLKKRALANNQQRGSRTHVVCDGVRVVGFHALAAGSVEHAASPKSLMRNMPKPIPAIILGRLAVDLHYQGQGIGAGLLQDAIFRALNAANQVAAASTARFSESNLCCCGFSARPMATIGCCWSISAATRSCAASPSPSRLPPRMRIGH